MCLNVLFIHVCTCTTCGGQKSILDILELELWLTCELTWGCWKFNPSLLQEHILLPAEPSLWPQKINDLCTPIKSLNSETKRLRSLQPVWATRRTLSENNPQKTKNKQKKSTVLTVPHLFSFLINHFHVKENYGAFCFMLKPCIWNQIMYLSNFPISLEVSIHYT